MMPTPVIADPTVVARTALLAQPTLTALVGTRVLYAIPATWPTAGGADLPLIVVRLVDDRELRPEAINTRVQLDIWGAGPSTADVINCKAIAAVVRSVARDLNGDWPAGRIRNCVTDMITPAPDPDTGRARFVVDLLFELST